MKNTLFISTIILFSLGITSCEKESTNTSNNTDRKVLNDSQILYHYYAEYSIDLAGVENKWEEDYFEYDNQNRIIQKTQYYYDPSGVLYDTNKYVYTYVGNRVIINKYSGSNVNYSRNIYTLNSNNLVISDSMFQKNFTPTLDFLNEDNYEYTNNKITREFSRDGSSQILYFWTNGNLSKAEGYQNGVLKGSQNFGKYSILVNKNYAGDFFNNGKRNRNWIESEDADKPTAAVHTYKSDSNGFVTEDLTTYSDPTTGKITRYFKIIYK